MLTPIPGQTNQERFLEALTIINQQNAEGPSGGLENQVKAPAPAPAHAKAGEGQCTKWSACVVTNFSTLCKYDKIVLVAFVMRKFTSSKHLVSLHAGLFQGKKLDALMLLACLLTGNGRHGWTDAGHIVRVPGVHLLSNSYSLKPLPFLPHADMRSFAGAAIAGQMLGRRMLEA